MGDTNIEGKIILKWIFSKRDVGKGTICIYICIYICVYIYIYIYIRICIVLAKGGGGRLPKNMKITAFWSCVIWLIM